MEMAAEFIKENFATHAGMTQSGRDSQIMNELKD
jgi:hypothetical protein